LYVWLLCVHMHLICRMRVHLCVRARVCVCVCMCVSQGLPALEGIANAIAALPALTHLDLTANNLQASGAVLLSSALIARHERDRVLRDGCRCRSAQPTSNSGLRTLLLGRNALQCAGIVALKSAFLSEARSTHVDAKETQGPRGSLSSLERLVVDENDIRQTGARALSQCVAALAHLRHLSLRRNPIGNSGGVALVRAVAGDEEVGNEVGQALREQGGGTDEEMEESQMEERERRAGAGVGCLQMAHFDLSQCNLQGPAGDASDESETRAHPPIDSCTTALCTNSSCPLVSCFLFL
jgi:Leucine-rich repeat (LRR) protein